MYSKQGKAIPGVVGTILQHANRRHPHRLVRRPDYHRHHPPRKKMSTKTTTITTTLRRRTTTGRSRPLGKDLRRHRRPTNPGTPMEKIRRPSHSRRRLSPSGMTMTTMMTRMMEDDLRGVKWAAKGPKEDHRIPRGDGKRRSWAVSSVAEKRTSCGMQNQAVRI